jgi:hypothetical protein
MSGYKRFYLTAVSIISILALITPFIENYSEYSDVTCGEECWTTFCLKNGAKNLYFYNKEGLPLTFSPEDKVHEVHFYQADKRVKGKHPGYREIDFIQPYSKDVKYVFKIPAYKKQCYGIEIKKNPEDTIKWTFGNLDPYFYGITPSKKLINFCKEVYSTNPACGSYLWNYTGTQPNQGLAFDNNQLTYSQNAGGAVEYIYLNITKPSNTLNSSVFFFKINWTSNFNSTIPNACFNRTPIRLRTFTMASGGLTELRLSCYTSPTDITNFRMESTGGDVFGKTRIFEVIAYWNITTSVNYSIEGNNPIKPYELNTPINITLYPYKQTLCIDMNHPSIGTNYSCSNVTTNVYVNISYFRKSIFWDNKTYQNFSYRGRQNKTFYIKSHQFDEVRGLSFNISSYLLNNTYPQNVNVYLNKTLVKSINGYLYESKNSITDFNGSSVVNSTHFGAMSNLAGYIKLPKNSNISSAKFNVSFRKIYNNVTPNEKYILLFNTGLDCSVFHSLTSYTNCSHIYISGTNKISVIRATASDYRARLYQDLMVGDYYVAESAIKFPLLSSVISVYDLKTEITKDIGKNMFVVYSYSASNPTFPNPALTTTHLGKFSNILTNRNVSTWSNLKVYRTGSSASAYAYHELPSGTNLNSVTAVTGVVTASSEIGTNKTSDEKDNPDYIKEYDIVDVSSTQSAWAGRKTIILSAGNIQWNITDEVGHASDDLTTKNFNNEGIPDIESIYPNLLYFDVGVDDGEYEYNWSRELISSVRTGDVSSGINSYLTGCTADSEGYCYVPVYVISGTSSTIKLESLQVNYTSNWNPINIPAGVVQSFLNQQKNYTNIPITIENSLNGSMYLSNLHYDYVGSNMTYEITVHDSKYLINSSINVTFYYSDWNYSMPPNVDYIEFIPRTSRSRNVQPYGQSELKPILNITYEHYGLNFTNFYVRVNDTPDCVNYTLSTIYNKSSGIRLNESYLKENTTGLLLHYAFEGNSKDSTGNFHATNTGITFESGSYLKQGHINPPNNRLSYLNNPYLFNSSFSGKAFINSTNPFSVSFYLKVKSSHNPFEGIWTLSLISSANYYKNTSTYWLYALDKNGETKAVTTVDFNKYYFVTITNNKNNITKMYIDGILVNYTNSGTSLSFPATTSKTILIGKGYVVQPFNGTIDEFKVYNRELTSTEINNSYQNRYLTELNHESWKKIQPMASYGSKTNIYLWADYSCNISAWRLYQPELYFKACCNGCYCSDSVN